MAAVGWRMKSRNLFTQVNIIFGDGIMSALAASSLTPDTLTGPVNLKHIKSCNCKLDFREPAAAAIRMEKSEIQAAQEVFGIGPAQCRILAP